MVGILVVKDMLLEKVIKGLYMKNEYTQCLLVNGDLTEVAWIPSKFASIGKWIRVTGGIHWYIMEKWMKLDKESVESNCKDYRTQRQASDI